MFAGGSKIEASIPSNCVVLKDLDTVYSEVLHKKPYLKWKAGVIPELAAELFLYHQSKYIPEGLYAIIDIGGGTVDMAIFQKYRILKDRPANMYCLAQKVLPYGVEILESNKTNISKEVFQQTFAQMINDSLKRMDWLPDELQKIDVFFLGGGANNEWYRNNIIVAKARLKDRLKLNFQQSIDDFINSDESLIEKNQRLIIAQMISKDKSEITNVLGFPDYYKASVGQSRGTIVSKNSIEPTPEERRNEFLYGKKRGR